MDRLPGGLPFLTFDDASIPVERQFEVFRDTTAPLFDTRPLDSAATPHVSALDYFVDGLIVSRLCYSPQVLNRTPRHHSVAGNCLSVLLHYRGGWRGTIGADTNVQLDPDHVAIVDFGRPLACWTGDSDVIWIIIPRSRLDPSAWPKQATIARFHILSPRGRILTAAVERIWAEVTSSPEHSAAELAGGIIDAACSVLRAGDFTPDDRTMTRAMKDYIRDNLHDVCLDVDRLRATFFCSRTTIYRLFHADGGVAKYIRDQRMLRCFDELTRAPAARSTVARTATRWGFDNPSHFNRLFKAAFGLSPSTVVGRPAVAHGHRHSASSSARIARFHAWAAAL